MGTYTDDMQLWTQSAQNLWDEQGDIGAPTRRAVVSWIGYVTPPPGVDAALGDYAARGAPLLTADVRGVNAVRVDAPSARPQRRGALVRDDDRGERAVAGDAISGCTRS